MTDALPTTPAELMASFAERTGVTGERTQRRYLWTDAFAVCNFLGLGETDRALALIDRVHHQLGRHRADDPRRGWISGLPEAEGDAHPTAGGLRIGKPLPEAATGEPADDRLEWDRDGQYFHYLTKWMHALDEAARATRETRLLRFSRELADTAHRHFVYTLRGTRRMYWKMSIDLTRPLVASMGHHDPLDGYVTCLQLDATARALGSADPDLSAATSSFHDMLEPRALATADPLGIGGLLGDAYRLVQIDPAHPLIERLVAAATTGLARYVEQPDLRASANHRLAFRELGLAIGLAAADAIGAPLARFARLRSSINAFWLAAEHRRARAYRDHEDINDVMLATSLAPTGYLVLR
jgi:hypothetical protein